MIKQIKYLFKNTSSDLIIYDTMFPNPITGFRNAEFSAYLENYKNAKIFVNPTDYPAFNQTENDWKRDVGQLPQPLKSKVFTESRLKISTPKLFYCVFLNNIYPNIEWLDQKKIPFIFTLYPGGGFDVKSEATMIKLKRVCSSKNLQKIIVTQQFTKEFLLKNNLCSLDKIAYIFGGIIPQNSINSVRAQFFNKYKKNLNICFCAAKYTERGVDKGYDIFMDVCKILGSKYDYINFHIVGGFTEKDIPVDEILREKFFFHGYKSYDDLKSFFLSQDIILSPNRPFVISEGSFDGFPLGTVVEAALNGVIPIVTDALNQNTEFNKDEIHICPANPEAFINKIEELMNLDFENLATKTINKFREIYSDENQLNARIEILDEFLTKEN